MAIVAWLPAATTTGCNSGSCEESGACPIVDEDPRSGDYRFEIAGNPSSRWPTER